MFFFQGLYFVDLLSIMYFLLFLFVGGLGGRPSPRFMCLMGLVNRPCPYFCVCFWFFVFYFCS